MADKFRCAKCKKHKSRDHFHKDRSRASGIQRYCKPCKKGADAYGKQGFNGKFVLYYLPKERYIGMTKNFNKRVSRHKENGKNVEWAFIVVKTRHMKLAHLLETLLHMIGFDGFRY
jgi:hypothetical protein